MFCPRCGLEQTSLEKRFCSRCGFPMGGVALLVAAGGDVGGPLEVAPKPESPRRRGVKQGAFIFMLSFLVVPIVSIITISLHAEPYLVSVVAILLIMGGLLRMAYAWMFEESGPKTPEPGLSTSGFVPPLGAAGASALPPATSVPASAFVPPGRDWRDTNDLQPASVTDPTTKLLKEE